MTSPFFAGQQDYIAQLNALAALVGLGGVTPLSIAVTGTPAVPFRLMRVMTPVIDKMDGTQFSPASGFAAESLNYAEGATTGQSTMTSLALTNLNCLTSGMNVTGSTVLATLAFPALVLLGSGTYQITSLPALTSLNLSAVQFALGPITLSTMTVLASFNLTNLEYASGITISSVQSLTSFTAPALVTCVGPLTLTDTALSSISLPVLTAVQQGAFTVGGASNPSLISISAPNLVNVDGNVDLSAISNLTSMNLNKLALAGDILLEGASPLTTLSLPALIRCGSILLSSMASLTTFSMGATLKRVSGNVSVSGCALNQASVDGVLARLAALDGTNGTTAFSGPQSVALNAGTSSTPSSAGLTSKATLQARGVKVIHN